MFIVLLKFSDNVAQAGTFMDGHIAWVKRGFDEGVFLISGTIQPSSGGAIIAHNTSLSNLQRRVAEDPFVVENVVISEILEITPGQADERFTFLLDK
ncbi:MAG: hypothetical protein AB2551_12890 [Candidatus Thiodiazotropha sp.]